MALCSNCGNYNREYDEKRQQYVDVIVEGSDAPPQHFCIMYDDHIADDIFYKNADCGFYSAKAETQG